MKTKSILRKIFVPFSAMVAGMLVVFFIIEYLCSLTELKNNSVYLFEESVSTRRDFLESKLTGQWSEIITTTEKLTGEIEDVLEEEQVSASRTASDDRLNQKILERLADPLVEIVKWNGTTDGFVILNGPAAANGSGGLASVYVVNDSPNHYDRSNSSIQYARGSASISKKMKIPLASSWKADMELDKAKDDFFFLPYEAGQKGADTDISAYGTWSIAESMNGQDKKVLLYSVPLILSDKTVVGVMGIGISADCLSENIQMESGEHSLTRSYMFAQAGEDGSMVPVVFSGQGENVRELKELPFSIEEDTITVEGGNKFYTSAQNLALYSANSPVQTGSWYLVGIEKQSDLFAVYNRSMWVQFLLMAFAMLCCFGSVLLVGKKLSDPIRKMMDELRASDPNRSIHLHKTHISEMDELADSIGSLSDRVAKANSKLSQIIHMSDAKISVFEYKQSENMIYVSPEFCAMIGWTDTGPDSITAADFRERMISKFGEEAFVKEHIFETNGDTGSCWMRLTQKQEDNVLLGVLVDITREVQEKMRVEYERDNDSLTGLMNRRAFERNIIELFARTEKVAVGVFLAWDLDNLKHFNDTYGHNTGDDYIIALAGCLKMNNSSHTFSARRSGDEFVTFAYGDTKEEVMAYVEKIWEDARATQFLLPDGQMRRIQISMGMAWYPEHTKDPEELAAYADFALYQVKHGTKGTSAVFDPELYKGKQ